MPGLCNIYTCQFRTTKASWKNICVDCGKERTWFQRWSKERKKLNWFWFDASVHKLCTFGICLYNLNDKLTHYNCNAQWQKVVFAVDRLHLHHLLTKLSIQKVSNEKKMTKRQNKLKQITTIKSVDNDLILFCGITIKINR